MIVYFVRNGDVFTGSDTTPHELTVQGVIFYGNNTIFVNHAFSVGSDAIGVKIYNISYTNYTKGTVLSVNASDVIVDNCSFINVGGEDVINGGALKVTADDVVISNSHFINSNATHVSSESNLGDGIGGAIYINASNIRVENCTFENNTASNTGSHLYIDEDNSNITLFNNKFKFGKFESVFDGSSIVIQGTLINITDNDFINNT